jgi:reductive dehalogenase
LVSVVSIVLLTLGSVLLLGLLAAAWTSRQEGEARAAGLLLLLALLAPDPFILLGWAGVGGLAGPAASAGSIESGATQYAGIALLAITLLTLTWLLVPGRAPVREEDTPRVRIDERDIMFSRRLLEPGSRRFREYYAANPDKKAPDEAFRAEPGLLSPGASASHPLAFPAADASFATIEHLRPFVSGETAAKTLEIDAPTATDFLERWTRKLGAVSVGFTELEEYHLYTHVGRGPDWGQPVTLDHRYAIALTVEMDKATLDHAPLAPTVMESAQQYVESGVIAIQLAEFIRRLGYPARAHIDGNYRVVCPLVARDAGLGEIGRMGLLMTPELGPRVRIAVVTTDLPLVPSARRRDPTMIDFCTRCRKCADVCPSDAIQFGDRVDMDGVRRWQIDSEACFTFWCATGTDCARCMRACPYSHPDNWLHNLVRAGVRRSPRFRRLAIRGDDWLYGRKPAPKPLPNWMG